MTVGCLFMEICRGILAEKECYVAETRWAKVMVMAMTQEGTPSPH